MLPLRTRVDLGAMAMKWFSVFPRDPSLVELQHQIVYCHIRTIFGWGSYPTFQWYFSVSLTVLSFGVKLFNNVQFLVFHKSWGCQTSCLIYPFLDHDQGLPLLMTRWCYISFSQSLYFLILSNSLTDLLLSIGTAQLITNLFFVWPYANEQFYFKRFSLA